MAPIDTENYGDTDPDETYTTDDFLPIPSPPKLAICNGVNQGFQHVGHRTHSQQE